MLSIIIPVYNEAGTIAEVIQRVTSLSLDKQIIIVDDGSSDGTADVLAQIGSDNARIALAIITHDQNQGKGAAIRTGLQYANGDIVTILDADLEYDPNDLISLVAPIQADQWDVVFGSRFLGSYKASHWTYNLANVLLTGCANILYRQRLTDVYTCYKVFSSRVARNLVIDSSRFEVEAELTAKVLREGWRVGEMPISYKSRSVSEGKKIKPKDGFLGIWTLFKYRFMDVSLDAKHETA